MSGLSTAPSVPAISRNSNSLRPASVANVPAQSCTDFEFSLNDASSTLSVSLASLPSVMSFPIASAAPDPMTIVLRLVS
ncbi:MAG: hypothetical protein QGG14_06350 [Planctomycetota bacterium]|nr:hypothetical protein [Planctomycetota bacterium]